MPRHASSHRVSPRVSPRVRRVRSLLPALVAGPLLICCATPSPASAKAKKPAAATQVIEIELRELGSDSSREFLVPVEGRISGWTDLFGESRFCRLRSSATHDERSNLRIRCFTHARSKLDDGLDFEFEAERVLALGEPTILGELESREGQRLQVLGTRR